MVMEKVDIFEGLMVVNPMVFFIDVVVILHFFTQWYMDYKKTGWKLNYWHFGIFMSFILPFGIMYPFAASSMNAMSTGADYIKISNYTDEAYLITLCGYLCICCGGLYAKRQISYTNTYKTFIGRVVYTNLTKNFAIRFWLILCIIFFLIAILLSIRDGMAFNARGWFLVHPEYRFIGNFFSSIFPLTITYIGYRYLCGYKSKLERALLVLTVLGGVGWGSRGMLFSPFLSIFIYWIYIHKKVSFVKIVFCGFFVIFGVIVMAILRSGGDIENFALLMEMILANVFYGNSFSDCRDFAWILSGFGENDYKMGSTYISGIFAFLPSSMFEWRRDYAIGPLTLELAGLDNPDGEHPGLRGGSFFEVFLNFGWFGVLVWGIVLGYLMKKADLWIRFYIDRNGDVINAYIKTIPIILASFFSVTAGMFGLYVFVFYHLSSLLINAIPIYLNSDRGRKM